MEDPVRQVAQGGVIVDRLDLMEATTCPACGSAGRRTSRRLDVEDVAARLCPPARDAGRFGRMKIVLARLWGSDHVDVVVCGNCQLGFTNPLVEGDGEFYSILHERVGYPSDRWEFNRARQFISELDRTTRVLDVGAGAGDFLLSIDSKHDRHAVEASETLRALLRSRQINAVASIDECHDRFDLVTMFHVIQYFADPVSLLKKVRSALKDEGRLMLSVPNALAVGSPDDLVSPPHPLTRWNRDAIEKVFKRAGLKVESMEFIPQPISSLMWAAHASTRANIARNPRGISARVDAMRSGPFRNNLLKILGVMRLPRVLPGARSRLFRSQILVVGRC